jgi:LL-diaminopimelate aminotransferase
MTGWRVGWAVGNADAMKALATLKTNLDSGIFNAVQRGAIAALTGPQDHLGPLLDAYRRRRDLFVSALNDLGWDLKAPLGSFYVWFPTRDGTSSASFADLLLERAGVVVTPGTGYGANGEGYVRASMTIADDRLEEAVARIRDALE